MMLRQDLLERILGQPSAPFRERHVMAEIGAILKEHGVPYFIDPIGNLVVGVSSKAAYLKLLGTRSKEPVRLAIAHMDHPGFHGGKWLDSERLAFVWLGGSPLADLEGRSVWLADREGWWGTGKLESFTLIPSGRAIEKGVIRIESAMRKAPAAQGLFGGFSFRAPYWVEDRILYTKAADDLVGSYAIVQAAIENYSKKGKKRKPAPFLGLLTRAEEVGFIGAIGHFELGWWKKAKRPLVCLSLETSRTLPGAEIGKGPVIRLGDRANVFTPSYSRLFSDLAEKKLPGKHQRRIMDGGTCEATAALTYGIPAIGISVPLGNYHNQCLEGGPDAGPPNSSAPEFISLDDVEGMLQLMSALFEPGLGWDAPYEKRLTDLRKKYRGYSKLLSAGLRV